MHNLDIPAGSLSDALAALEKATGLNIVISNASLGSLNSAGVKGIFTAQEALAKILNGTSAAGRFVSQTRVVVELRGAGESITVSESTGQILPSPKYTAPIRDLPQTITVIPETVIQSTGPVSLVEALRTVPGITFGAGKGGNPVGDRPFLRGSDTQSSTFVDGMRDIGSQSREVFNLESVEVAKGPNGAFGGRGTSGGSLNLNNKAPRGQNQVAASFSPGTGNFYRGTLDLNAKITDAIALRFNALGHDAGVAGRDAVHSNRWGIAPTLLVGLGKKSRATFSYYQLNSDDMPDAGIPYNNPVFVPRTDGMPRILEAGDGSPLSNVDRRTFYGLSDRDFRKEKVRTGTVRLEHDFSERLFLRNTTRYSKSDQDNIWTQPDDSKGNIYYGLLWRRTNTRVSDVDTIANQTDLSGNGETGSLRHTFATGLEFSCERGENDAYTVATGTNTCPSGAGAASGYNCTDLFKPNLTDPWNGAITRNNNPTNSQTVTKSLYGFDTVTIIPKLEATVGLRLDNYSANFVSARAAGTNVRSAFDRDDLLFNYRLGLTYKPAQAGSIYGGFSTSSTPAGSSLA